MAQIKAAAFCSLNQFSPQPSTRCSCTEKNSPSLLIQKSILPLPLQTAKQAVSASHLCSVIYLLQIPVAHLLMQFFIVSVSVNTLASHLTCERLCPAICSRHQEGTEDKGCAPRGPSDGEPPPHARIFKEVLVSGNPHPSNTHSIWEATLNSPSGELPFTQSSKSESWSESFPVSYLSTLKLFPWWICWSHLKRALSSTKRGRGIWLF